MIRKNRRAVDAFLAEALAHLREERFEQAIAVYDQMLASSSDESARELAIIGKADALLSEGKDGEEIRQLAGIVLRRRSHLHVFKAAYALMFRWRLENDIKRAIFYGKTALTAARKLRNPMYLVATLNELGNVHELNSDFAEAHNCFVQGLEHLPGIADEAERSLALVALTENLGYTLIQLGELDKGVAMIETVLPEVPASNRSDAFLDLAIGYLRLERLQDAERLAAAALAQAVTAREKRNARYILGEIAYRNGDIPAAELYFDALAAEYPEFQNLTKLLMAVDILPLLNLRL